MLSRWYSLLLLSLLALLLPVQKWTAVELNTAYTYVPVLAVSDDAVSHDAVAHDIHGKVLNRSHSVPHSTQNAGPSSEAVIHQGRWTLGLRSATNDNTDDNNEPLGFSELDSLVWLIAETPSSSFVAMRLPQTPYQHGFSDHRLSGWKESNALYVALNAQFS